MTSEAARAIVPVIGEARAQRTATLVASSLRRKQDSRDRLLAAAADCFCDRDYLAVSVDDIASRAGVSRVTFYRHFAGKAALTVDLFRSESAAAMPRYLALLDENWQDRAVVAAWLERLFAADAANSRLLRIFTQATVEEPGFVRRAQELIVELIDGLGSGIPAFVLDPQDPAERRRWLEAWLLLYEILDQSNHAALNSGVASDPLVIELLADRFVAFVLRKPI
jgi:AcrR family transcriptional regulator